VAIDCNVYLVISVSLFRSQGSCVYNGGFCAKSARFFVGVLQTFSFFRVLRVFELRHGVLHRLRKYITVCVA